MKKRQAQSGDRGIIVTALGYAMKARPGPERKKRSKNNSLLLGFRTRWKFCLCFDSFVSDFVCRFDSLSHFWLRHWSSMSFTMTLLHSFIHSASIFYFKFEYQLTVNAHWVSLWLLFNKLIKKQAISWNIWEVESLLVGFCIRHCWHSNPMIESERVAVKREAIGGPGSGLGVCLCHPPQVAALGFCPCCPYEKPQLIPSMTSGN